MKNKIKDFILFFGSPGYRFFRSIFSSQAISPKKITSFDAENQHVFFGYYDVNPFSDRDDKLLTMRVPIINRAPDMEDEGEIGYFDLKQEKNEFVALGRTNTWCWQQGCRLQWHNKNQIIFNCLVDGKYGAVIKKVTDGKTVKEIGKPLYSISPDGKWGLSLDFSRLQRLRPGYGYGILSDNSQGVLIPKDNCIELINLDSNEVRKLFFLKEISEIDPHDSMKSAEHYFNHILFNPSGKKFLFFHLWTEKTGKRYSRLFTADRDGKNLKLLNNSGSVSHYNWISDDEIILYSYVDEISKYSFAVFNSLDGKIRYFGKHIPQGDGHPTLLKDQNTIITDTYQDLFSQRSLLAYDIKKDQSKVLARFDNYKKFAGEFRCDLHPRISHDQKMICVDRIVNGKREMAIVPLNAELF